MGASAQLSATELTVEPGHSTTATLTVRNNGSVVDRFSFESVGSASRWISFSPDTLSLFPQASGTVNITLAPPRDPTVAAGSTPFGVRVISSEDPEEGVVEEGSIEIGAYSDVAAELLPRVTRGRRWARAQLVIDNRSNCPYRADLEGRDPSTALTIALNPVTAMVPPGAASFVKVRIRPKQTFWRGPSTNKPYGVVLKTQPLTGASGDAAPPAAAPPASGGSVAVATAQLPAVGPHKREIVADGSMLQESLIASWVFKALAALVALAVLFTILWFALFKPQIKSTALNAVRSQQQSQGNSGNTGSNSGNNSGAGSQNGGTGGSSSNVTTAVPPSGGNSSSSGASSSASVNGTGTANGNGTTTIFTVPSGRTLEITDILVENSAGNSGVISLERGGTVLMQWALANFRDLDYHWIVPTVFGSGSKVQMVVSGCPNACTPGIYYAGNLVKS